MSTSTVVLPDFNFADSFYYSDILRRIRLFNRTNCPEITSEVAEEPFIQLERAFALVGHLNNVLLDLAANECLLPTLRLQDSARRVLALIGYQLKDYSPATVDLLLELSGVLTASREVLETPAAFETDRDENGVSLTYEVLDGLTIGPSTVLDLALFERPAVRTAPTSGTDGLAVVGSIDVIESATMLPTAADLGRYVTISGSVLGANNVYKIAEIPATGRIRLVAAFGGEDPSFVSETGLSWAISEISSNVAADLSTTGTPVTNFWGTPAVGCKLYFGSQYVLWSKFGVKLSTPYGGLQGVWEYYDPDPENERPDSTVNLGTTLRLGANSLLGTDHAEGALVRVTHLRSGISEIVPSTWFSGQNVVVTTGFLGQTGTPSTVADDYSISANWVPLEGQIDGSLDLTVDGTVTYTFPQTLTRAWRKCNIEGTEGYFLRYRIVIVTAPSGGAFDQIDITSGTQYAMVEAVQGTTVLTEARQSSTGLPGQQMKLSRTPGLRDSVQVWVDEGGGDVEWSNLTAVGETLLNVGAKDRAFQVAIDSLGQLTVIFGDGSHGKIPTIGTDNVGFQYRMGASDNGNVGSEMITRNTNGSSFVGSVTNPRPANGWRIAEGADDSSLAELREAGPASIRTLGRACSVQDYTDLSVGFETSSGTRPVVRAIAIEEGYGPKTVKIVAVGTNGVALPASAITELETYFNGNELTGEVGIGQANTEARVVSFTPRILSLTITVRANSNVTEDAVLTRISTLISPTAKDSSGGFVWAFGGRVPTSRIAAEIFSMSPGNVFDVDVSGTDIELSADELPILDATSTVISMIRSR